MESPCEGAFVEGNAGDDGDIFFAAGREEFVERILIEDVVDDLDGIDEAGVDGFDAVPRLPAVEGDAGGPDFARRFQFFQLRGNAGIFGPIVIPGVKLNEVERFEPEIFQALVDVFRDVSGRVAIVHSGVVGGGPGPIFWRDFAGDVKVFG